MEQTRKAIATWSGNLAEGKSTVKAGTSGAFPEMATTWKARTEEAGGLTSPEELLAAAHASCYSMAFSNELSKAGHTVESIDTKADVSFQPGQGITGSHLTTRASVPGISQEEFAEIAEKAKKGCPVSSALTGTTITLDAALA